MHLDCIPLKSYTSTMTDNSKVLFVISKQRLEQIQREIYDFVDFKFKQLLEEPLQNPFTLLGKNSTRESSYNPSSIPRSSTLNKTQRQNCRSVFESRSRIETTRAPSFKRKVPNIKQVSVEEEIKPKKKTLLNTSFKASNLEVQTSSHLEEQNSSKQKKSVENYFRELNIEINELFLPDSNVASKCSSKRGSSKKIHLDFDQFESQGKFPFKDRNINQMMKKVVQHDDMANSKEALLSSLDDFLSLQHIDGSMLRNFAKIETKNDFPFEKQQSKSAFLESVTPLFEAKVKPSIRNSFSSSEAEILTDKERIAKINRRLSRCDSVGEGWERRESLFKQTGLAFSFNKTRIPSLEKPEKIRQFDNPFLS